MKKNPETGHVKNLTSAEEIESFCKQLTGKYKPSRAELVMDSLSKKVSGGREVMEEVSSWYTTINNTINKRVVLFDAFSILTGRVVGAAISCGLSAETLADVKYLQRKIQGRRAKKLAAPAPAADGVIIPTIKHISASQAGFDQRVEHFSRLVLLLEAQPDYKPNEEDLTVASLNDTLVEMRLANTAVIDATTGIVAARTKRNDFFYHEKTGLIKLLKDVKEYIKSVFGSRSAEYKTVRSFNLRTIKSK